MGHRLPVRDRRAHRRASLKILALALSGVALLGACSSDGDEATPAAGDTTSQSAGPGAVTIQGFMYKPSPTTVKVGESVTWTNTDQILHTATAGAPDAKTDVFDVEMDGPGKSGSHTFEEAGSYPYFCSRHNSMTGEVIVTA